MMEPNASADVDLKRLILELEQNIKSVRKSYQLNAIFYGFVLSLVLRVTAHGIAQSTRVQIWDNKLMLAPLAAIAFVFIWIWHMEVFRRKHEPSLTAIQDGKRRLGL